MNPYLGEVRFLSCGGRGNHHTTLCFLLHQRLGIGDEDLPPVTSRAKRAPRLVPRSRLPRRDWLRASRGPVSASGFARPSQTVRDFGGKEVGCVCKQTQSRCLESLPYWTTELVCRIFFFFEGGVALEARGKGINKRRPIAKISKTYIGGNLHDTSQLVTIERVTAAIRIVGSC